MDSSLSNDNILLINYFEWKVQVMIDKPGLFVKFIWDLLFVVFSLLQISFSSGSPIYWGTACSCEYDLTAFFFCVAVIALHGLWINYFLSSISLLLMSGQKNTFFLFSRRMWRLGDDSGSKFQNFIKVSLNLFYLLFIIYLLCPGTHCFISYVWEINKNLQSNSVLGIKT